MSDHWIDPGHIVGSRQLAPDVVHAGFLRRWAALFLDQLILGVAFYALLFAVMIVVGVAGGFEQLEQMSRDNPPAWVIAAYFGMILLYYFAAGTYFSLMESSRHQATLGKMALGIKVVDLHGGRLSPVHAVGRWFAASLSYLTMYIGFLLAAFTERKQALHDMVASTLVVDRWAYTEHPERQQRGLGGCGMALVIFMFLMIGLAVLGVLAAIALPSYHQYLTRAQFSQVEAALTPLREQVATAEQTSNRCPDNDSEGFGTPESYAAPGINRIVIGEFETGYCGISVWMPPASGSVERQFMVELDPDDGNWYCTNKAGVKQLPAWCH